MKDKIIKKATDMFLKLGFKSVTMDDIAGEMCISKKTIYKYFSNKERLIEEATEFVHNHIYAVVDEVLEKNLNAIEENFEIKKMYKKMFQSIDQSPVYQLRKHYPDIYIKIINNELDKSYEIFRRNLQKGIAQNLYRNDMDIESSIKFYYTLLFSITENTESEKEASELELKALEYHIRAIATPEGIIELENQINKSIQ
jgi:AcrR family transcriptional regulator